MFKRFMAILLILLMLPVGLLVPLTAYATTSPMDLTQDFIATAGSLIMGDDSVFSFSGAGTNASDPVTTFTMPDSTVTVVATWNTNDSSINVDIG